MAYGYSAGPRLAVNPSECRKRCLPPPIPSVTSPRCPSPSAGPRSTPKSMRKRGRMRRRSRRMRAPRPECTPFTARPGSTSTSGSGTARIRRCWPTSRPRTATPTRSCGTPTELQERLYQEMRGRIKETDLSVPERIDGWLYYTPDRGRGAVSRSSAAAPSTSRMRGRGGAARPQPARRGPRLLPAGRVRGEPRPPAAGLLGGHQRRGVVHALREGPGHRRRCCPRRSTNVSPAAAWANDSRTLFYVVLDDARRP